MLVQQLFANIDWLEIYTASLDTLYMLGVSVFFSTIIGIPIGIIMYLTSQQQLLQNRVVYGILAFIVNLLRSVPFIILLIILMPVTAFLVGTSLGVRGVIPPLIIGAFPFFARLVEGALLEVNRGVVEMAKSCGANTWQIIWRILLPEILPSLIANITITAIALVSYTAMAGVVGGGGLGDLAIRYGYQRFQTNVMIITVVLMVVLVQLLQLFGDKIAALLRKRS